MISDVSGTEPVTFVNDTTRFSNQSATICLSDKTVTNGNTSKLSPVHEIDKANCKPQRGNTDRVAVVAHRSPVKSKLDQQNPVELVCGRSVAGRSPGGHFTSMTLMNSTAFDTCAQSDDTTLQTVTCEESKLLPKSKSSSPVSTRSSGDSILPDFHTGALLISSTRCICFSVAVNNQV